MGWKFCFIVIIPAFFNTVFAFGQQTSITPHFSRNDLDRQAPGWIIPNEETPSNAKPILALAPEGVYVVVGAERGFIGASIADGITDLFLFDYNNGQLSFDALNATLIEISHNRKDFLWLKFSASHEDWMKRCQEKGIAGDIRTQMNDPHVFESWTRLIRAAHTSSMIREPPSQTVKDYGLKDANYHYDDEQFERLHKLAIGHHIKIFKVDLGKIEDVEALAKEVEKTGHKLSVLDLSNLWHETWFGSDRGPGLTHLHKIVETFQPVSRGDSVVLFSDWILVHHFDERFRQRHEELAAPLRDKDNISIEEASLIYGEGFHFAESLYHGFQMNTLKDEKQFLSSIEILKSLSKKMEKGTYRSSFNGIIPCEIILKELGKGVAP